MPFEIGVSVRRGGRVERQPVRIRLAQGLLKVVTTGLRATAHAADEIEPAVQVDDLPVPGGLMQTIHILGQQHFAAAAGFELRQRMMGVIRHGLAEPPPSDQAARPIALPRRFLAHEVLEIDRLGPLPVAVRIAIVGNA